MEYFYPLLLYIGFGSGLILLGMGSFVQLQPFRKPVSATCLTILTLLWMLLPAQGRWMLSAWSPSSVLGGQIVLDITPAIWWCGLVLGVVFSGVAWVEVTDRRPSPPLTGALSLTSLMVIWLALTGGSLLTTLAAWAIFDLLWCVVGLMSGADGERVTFGLALHGVSSVIVWGSSLLLLQGGASSLWWLTWPTPSVLIFLLIAALVRVGFYPFHIVFPRGIGATRLLSMIYLMGPLTGLALLYRVLTFPGAVALPNWAAIWGVTSLFVCSLMAWAERGRQPLLWAGYALLFGTISGAVILNDGALLLMGAAVWLLGGTLLLLARGQDKSAVWWSWPIWLAVFFMLGVPPSPVGSLYLALLESLPWVWKIILVLGMGMIGAIFVRSMGRPASGSVTPSSLWRGVVLALAFLIFVLALAGTSMVAGILPYTLLGFVLWGLSLVLVLALARFGSELHEWFELIRPGIDFLDMQWFYRSIWRGAEHMLALLRVSAEVFEGSGAILWSLLVVMLLLLVVVSR